MSLVQCGWGLSSGSLGDLAVVGGRCLGGAGIAIRVSGPSPLSSSSLPCSAAPSELQPFFHPWAGSDRCGFRPVDQGGYRACSSFARLLQPSLCDAQGHRWVAPGDLPLVPQRLCGCLPLSYGDHPNRSSFPSGRGLVGVPGSPVCLPSGSGSSIFSPVPQVLRGGVGQAVLRSLSWPLDGSSGLYPCHGPCLRDHASSWLPDPPVSRRFAGPGFHLPGDCSGEGFSSLALPASWDSRQSPQELFDSEADSGLSRDYDSDYSFEGFPDPQADPEGLFFFRTFCPPSLIRCLFGGNCWGSCLQCQLWFLAPGSGCVRFRFVSMWPVVSNPTISRWGGVPITIRIFCGGPTSLIFKSACLSASLSPTCVCSQTHRTQAGAPLSAMSISQARGLRSHLGFPSITESFWRFCWLFGDSFLLFVDVWWRCSPTTPPLWRTSRNRVVLAPPRSTPWLSRSSGFARSLTYSFFLSSSQAR